MAQNTVDNKFLEIWEEATRNYQHDTKIKLTTHPLCGCNNPDAVLDALDRELQAFQNYRDKKEKLRKWLKPMLHLIGSLSETAGEAAGVVRTALSRLVLSTDMCRGRPSHSEKLASLRSVCWCRCVLVASLAKVFF
jgi:hypothetical protein